MLAWANGRLSVFVMPKRQSGQNRGPPDPKAAKAPKRGASSKSVDAASVWAEQATESLSTVEIFRKWLPLCLQ